ncbi:hypothetical protein [Myxococcus phage Mx1]|nr:hypothetical protein [Myxococcus phage Mx1]
MTISATNVHACIAAFEASDEALTKYITLKDPSPHAESAALAQLKAKDAAYVQACAALDDLGREALLAYLFGRFGIE